MSKTFNNQYPECKSKDIKEIYEEFLYTCKQAIKLGATIIGRCCGSSPKHIILLRNKVIR